MKRTLFAIALIVLIQMPGFSQNKRSPYLHEFGIGIGIEPLSQSIVLDRISNDYYGSDKNWFRRPNGSYIISTDYSITESYNRSHTYTGNWSQTESLQLHYSYCFSRWFELSGTLAYCGATQNRFSKATGEILSKNKLHLTSLIPSMRFVWLNTSMVKLYASLGLGLVFEDITKNEISEKEIYPAINFNYFGVSVGKKIYGFTELSLGNLGLVTFGVGIKL